MARWSAVVMTPWTPTAVADTTNFTDTAHHTIQGGTSTQRGELREVFLGGVATASAPTYTVLGRTSTVGGTLTAIRFAAMDPSTAALGTNPTAYQASTTKPQRSATLGMLLNLGFNSFGGIVRWVNGPDEIISFLGNTASLGELSVNGFTGSSASASVTSGLVIETL